MVPKRPDRHRPDEDEFRAPDAIEPIMAYKAWGVDSDGRLRSLNRQAQWLPAESAAQNKSRVSPARSYGPSCTHPA